MSIESKLAAIADEMMKDCPEETREQHERIAERLRERNIEAAINLSNSLPETYYWLKTELAKAYGVKTKYVINKGE